MVDAQLMKRIKAENEDLKRELSELKDLNSRLWKAAKSLNELECTPQNFSQTSDLMAMVMRNLSIALEAVNSENGSILLLDDETEELVFVAVVGDRHQELTGYRIPADSGVAGWVRKHKKAALVPDVRKDSRWISAVDQSIGFHTQSLMAVPLMAGNRVLGVMEVVNALSEDCFNEQDLAVLQFIAHLTAFVFGCLEEALDSHLDPYFEDDLD